MIVRGFRRTDTEAVHEIFRRAVREGTAGRYSDAERGAWAPDDAAPPDWEDWLAGMATFVAEEEGRVTGFMALDRDGLLDMAFVLPQRMGKGVASSLCDRLLGEARARGLARLTTEASHYARGFFGRRGWKELARQ